jgi:protein-disulfide isomerase
MSKNSPQLDPLGNDKPRTGKAAKAERRAAAAAALKEQQRKQRRRTIAIQAGVGALVVAIVAVAAIFVLTRDDAVANATPPSGVTSDGGLVVGATDAPVTIVAYEDFQCPVCQQFEEVSGDLLAQYEAGTDVKVEYRPIAFLDNMSSTEYSTRSLNAAACVADTSTTEVWKAFHDSLFANQPAEGGDGLPDSELISLAVDAGADESAITSCVEDGTFEDWTKKVTRDSNDAGVTGTPTVFVNGTRLDSFDPDTIEAAVADASAS